VPDGNEERISSHKRSVYETEVFRKLLCAMYNRPYKLESVQELEDIVAQADFYCALPILSSTIVNGLLGSPMFESQDGCAIDSFGINAGKLILVAYKLRNSVLFRECFVHVVDQWNSDHMTESYELAIEATPAVSQLVM